MKRDYVSWYKIKAKLEAVQNGAQFSEREVWWASIGVNIGDEEDGKNGFFERPVLVVKKYNKGLFLAMPLSTAKKMSKFYYPISVGDEDGIALLSQGRVISSKRLQRRLGKITPAQYQGLIEAYAALHQIKSNPQQAEGSRAPNGDL